MSKYSLRNLATAVALAGAGLTGLAHPGGAAIVVVSGSGSSPLGQTIELAIDGSSAIGYGLDVYQPLVFGTYEATVADVASFANGPRAAWIFENYGNVIWAGLAVQLALWDVVNDGGDGLTLGLVQVGDSLPSWLRDFGDEMITGSLGQSSTTASVLILTSTLGGTWQPVITGYLPPPASILAPPDSAEAPEPGTWLMMTAGLMLGGLYKRR